MTKTKEPFQYLEFGMNNENIKLKTSNDIVIGSGARDLLQTYLNDVLYQSKHQKISRNLNSKGK